MVTLFAQTGIDFKRIRFGALGVRLLHERVFGAGAGDRTLGVVYVMCPSSLCGPGEMTATVSGWAAS